MSNDDKYYRTYHFTLSNANVKKNHSNHVIVLRSKKYIEYSLILFN